MTKLSVLKWLFIEGNDELRDIRNLILYYMRNTGLRFGISSCQIHWFAKLAIFCFIWTCVLQIIALFMAKNDSEKLFECFSVLSFCLMGIFKLTILRSKYSRWSFLLNQISLLEEEYLNLSQEPFQHDHESDKETMKNCLSSQIYDYTNKFKRTSTILVRIYSSTAVFFILSPFIEYILKIQGYGNDDHPHILPGWRLLDDMGFLGYLLSITSETVAAVYCVCVHVAFDLTSVGLMIFICGQFILLRSYSERIGGEGKHCNFIKKRDTLAHYRIVTCHRIHVKLIHVIREFDKLIKNILGIYFFVATLTLCSVAVRLKTETMSTMQLMSLLQYMCATITQLFLFCSYGDSVNNESSLKMSQGPFGAAIWCLSPKIRGELITLGIGMMNSYRLHAGPFNSLDLPSFIQIVRAAYSYYAVLGKK